MNILDSINRPVIPAKAKWILLENTILWVAIQKCGIFYQVWIGIGPSEKEISPAFWGRTLTKAGARKEALRLLREELLYKYKSFLDKALAAL